VYSAKEIFYTLQGEGFHTGRPAVFCRFAGCNLWSGREHDRAAAACNFCDTEFVGTDGVGGGRFDSARELADAIAGYWPANASRGRFVVFTGGEPLLQIDRALLNCVHKLGFVVAVETNGTIAALDDIDWVCVSPKGRNALRQQSGNELKLVYPQPDAAPESFSELAFDHYFLQPMDGPRLRENTLAAIEYCLRNPQWRLSLQTHKVTGIR
jgi:7-carboxy-7-deazaguanine synthase